MGNEEEWISTWQGTKTLHDAILGMGDDIDMNMSILVVFVFVNIAINGFLLLKLMKERKRQRAQFIELRDEAIDDVKTTLTMMVMNTRKLSEEALNGFNGRLDTAIKDIEAQVRENLSLMDVHLDDGFEQSADKAIRKIMQVGADHQLYLDTITNQMEAMNERIKEQTEAFDHADRNARALLAGYMERHELMEKIEEQNKGIRQRDATINRRNKRIEELKEALNG